jgi:hypothetical protein
MLGSVRRNDNGVSGRGRIRQCEQANEAFNLSNSCVAVISSLVALVITQFYGVHEMGFDFEFRLTLSLTWSGDSLPRSMKAVRLRLVSAGVQTIISGGRLCGGRRQHNSIVPRPILSNDADYARWDLTTTLEAAVFIRTGATISGSSETI